MSFPPYNASVLSQYGSIFRFIPPQVVGGLVRPATPLFLPPTCHRQAYGGNPNDVPVPIGKRPRSLRLYGSVYLVQHGKQQATLTLHQFVCAITALNFLKSFSPYPIRIRTIGKARAIAADFQCVPLSGSLVFSSSFFCMTSSP